MIRVAFFGMGSIARRHIKNLSEVFNERKETFSIDVYDINTDYVKDESINYLIDRKYLIDELSDQEYDICFITNPTAHHYDTLKKIHDIAKYVFLEKPVFDNPNYDISLFNNQKVYVACPLRYSQVIQTVKSIIDISKVISVRSISSSYLPDWRPNIDYRKCYSAHKNQGGGVSIDLIHEWDYLTFLFGMPTNCYSIIDKKSNLEIDSDDVAIYIAKNDRITFEVHLDYYGRQSIREMLIFTSDDTISCDILNEEIHFLKENKALVFEKDRNKFQKDEIRHFLDIVDGKIKNDSTISHAVAVLKIANGGN